MKERRVQAKDLRPGDRTNLYEVLSVTKKRDPNTFAVLSVSAEVRFSSGDECVRIWDNPDTVVILYD